MMPDQRNTGHTDLLYMSDKQKQANGGQCRYISCVGTFLVLCKIQLLLTWKFETLILWPALEFGVDRFASYCYRPFKSVIAFLIKRTVTMRDT